MKWCWRRQRLRTKFTPVQVRATVVDWQRFSRGKEAVFRIAAVDAVRQTFRYLDDGKYEADHRYADAKQRREDARQIPPLGDAFLLQLEHA